jgi:toxin YoeB
VKVVFSDRGWEDYLWLHEQEPKLFTRLNGLIQECRSDPFKGIGKPEPLRDNWVGFWSRRIDQEHRLVYRIAGKGEEQRIEIAQCRFHY